MNNKQFIKFLVFIAITFAAFYGGILLIYISDIRNLYKYLISLILVFLLISEIFLIFYYFLIMKKRREIIASNFDLYIEESISMTGSGLIILNKQMEVIWCSNYIELRLNKEIAGKKINSVFKDFEKKIEENKYDFILEENGSIFKIMFGKKENSFIVQDITKYANLLKIYKEQQMVLGEIEIDNLSQWQATLSSDEMFKIQSLVIQMLEELVVSYNITYRQYVNGKFIIITNVKNLFNFIERKFDFIDELKKYEITNNHKITLSAGFGYGIPNIENLVQLSKDGLVQSINRGGDQVTINEFNKKSKYFGSKIEVIGSSSKIKIKQIARELEEKLKLKSITKVIILGHKIADLDAVGASLVMAEISKSFKKKVFIQNSTFDTTTTIALKRLFKKEFINEMFITTSKAERLCEKENTLIIILDTPTISRVESPFIWKSVSKENIFILDHHRISKKEKHIYEKNSYIDINSSSTCEIVSEITHFFERKIKISPQVAQMALNGIYLDTKQFTISTTTRTFVAASTYELLGASTNESSKLLKLPASATKLLAKILSNVEEIKPGYFLSVNNFEVKPDLISLSADEILRVSERKAAFVIAKLPHKKEYKMSARGLNTNVQIIAESVGGGGNFSASAAITKEDINTFKDNLIQSVISNKEKK